MKKLWNEFKRKCNAGWLFTENRQYRLLVFMAALLHFLFALTFFFSHSRILFVFNVFSTLFYLYHGIVTLRQGYYFVVYQSAVAEVLLHAGFATLLLGTEFGFMLYPISMIPMSFYLPYTIPKYRNNLRIPVITTLLIAIYYFFICILSSYVPQIYREGFPDQLKTLLFYLNSFSAFALTIFTSAAFLYEIYQMQASLERENHSLGKLANYDPLTHLLNRRSMNSYLQKAWEDAQKKNDVFTLIMSDIDDFKSVNDTYGHGCGDEVLKAVSRIVRKDVRSHDCICRWGGEEILILVHANREAAVSIAERICQDAAANVVSYNNLEVRVTLTLGIASYHGQPTIAAVISEADEKLYRGKMNGKNQVVF